mmetsp:Transcript_32599/g.45233  ORF Transcript_32599/g.45233 Transcript_32599/m.45233 type:complete len:202 (-) Transcript_32599:460-1065(-)|eukprot:CAMPEP_0196580792 /NCGR_PEP_ID=MMETSP1081-20130531/30626_1 /TAXON_ID=36882 /ORGANISM="Pyramimonas amylifera, Strain CCMP720" /LENGTH=201 /DNA_ID=CAMNT_0041900777 /DNA_START=199 /DNA_END=804 /DNA_ORIENTATION=+
MKTVRTADRTSHGVAGGKSKTRTRARALQNLIRMAPRDILFSQDSGFATFSDGRWVAQTIREIACGRLDPKKLPILRVVKASNGEMFTLDNRRLYCFQQCNLQSIQVELVEGEGGLQEYNIKRFGVSNGTTSKGKILIMKPPIDGNLKAGKAALVALGLCVICQSTAGERLSQLKFMKGSKKGVLVSGCEGCLLLVKFSKD